jgi:hypothetical protein
MMIRSIGALATGAALAILLAGPASAQPGRDRGGHFDRGEHYGHGDASAAIGGALLGLGIGALIGGAIVGAPPAYFPPPPVYYPPPPAYYPSPPAYYAPPPAYYAPPPPVYHGY